MRPGFAPRPPPAPPSAGQFRSFEMRPRTLSRAQGALAPDFYPPRKEQPDLLQLGNHVRIRPRPAHAVDKIDRGRVDQKTRRPLEDRPRLRPTTFLLQGGRLLEGSVHRVLLSHRLRAALGPAHLHRP